MKKKLVLTAMAVLLALSSAEAAKATKQTAAKTAKEQTPAATTGKGAKGEFVRGKTSLESKQKALVKQFNPAKDEAYDDGLKFGATTDEKAKVPAKYKNDKIQSEAWLKGFEAGRAARDVRISNAKRDGYAAGLNGESNAVPAKYSTVSKYYTESYNRGAEEGKNKAFAAGYNAGKTGTSANPTVPSQYKSQAAKYKEGYKKGYDEQVAAKQDAAYKSGLELGAMGKPKTVPAEHSAYAAKWNEGYAIGKADFDAKEASAYSAGHDAGFVAESATAAEIPESFAGHEAKYSEGFSAGFFENKGKESAAYDDGKKAGKSGSSADAPSVPSQHSNYAEKYREGYADGYNENQRDYQSGYNAGLAYEFMYEGYSTHEPYNESAVSGSDKYKEGYFAGLAKNAYNIGVSDAKKIADSSGWKDKEPKFGPGLWHGGHKEVYAHWGEGFHLMYEIAAAGYKAGTDGCANANYSCTVPSEYSSESALYTKYYKEGYAYARPLYTAYVEAYKAAYAKEYEPYDEPEEEGPKPRSGASKSGESNAPVHGESFRDFIYRMKGMPANNNFFAKLYAYNGGAKSGAFAGEADKRMGRESKF